MKKGCDDQKNGCEYHEEKVCPRCGQKESRTRDKKYKTKKQKKKR